mmetsp:Transcript_6848/g.12708  ORF Transcript_6848/g.12708 Transcript_6848/m.12708 type:complete len:96 (+) Transcript_6848:216-503(+)
MDNSWSCWKKTVTQYTKCDGISQSIFKQGQIRPLCSFAVWQQMLEFDMDSQDAHKYRMPRPNSRTASILLFAFGLGLVSEPNMIVLCNDYFESQS